MPSKQTLKLLKRDKTVTDIFPTDLFWKVPVACSLQGSDTRSKTFPCSMSVWQHTGGQFSPPLVLRTSRLLVSISPKPEDPFSEPSYPPLCTSDLLHNRYTAGFCSFFSRHLSAKGQIRCDSSCWANHGHQCHFREKNHYLNIPTKA